MAIRVLSQTALASATDTDLLSGVQVSHVLVTCLVVCNRASTPATFRLWIKLQGITTTDAQYLMYDFPISPNDSPVFTFGSGFGLKTGDVLSARASTANLSVTSIGEA